MFDTFCRRQEGPSAFSESSVHPYNRDGLHLRASLLLVALLVTSSKARSYTSSVLAPSSDAGDAVCY